MPAFENDLLRDMALFAEVAKRRSFRAAALALGLSPSLLSRRIAIFEKRLGVQLLQRTTRSVQLTEIGTYYVEQSQRLLEQVGLLHEDIRERSTAIRGHLCVAVPADFSLNLMGSLIREFLSRFTGISIDLDTSHPLSDWAVGHVDLAIHVGPLPDSSLVVHPLVQVNSHVYVAPEYFKSRLTPRHPRELSEHECVRRLDRSVDSIWQLRNGDEAIEVSVRGRLALRSFAMISRVVAEGMGIGVIPDYIVRSDLEAGRVVPILKPWKPPLLPVVALTPHRLIPAKTRAFLAFLRERLVTALL